jgi:hypothetical protein
MNENYETARELDARIDELAAEITSRVFPLLLQHGLKDEWLASQLKLWALLCGGIREWTGRWRLASLAGNSDGLRDFVAADLASRTFEVIQTGASGQPPRQIRTAVVEACRTAMRGAARPSERSTPCVARRQPERRVVETVGFETPSYNAAAHPGVRVSAGVH